MKIFLASDHAAVDAKAGLVKMLKAEHEVVDLGPMTTESVHYPEYASKLAKAVVTENAMGVLLCGSGIGVSVVANKYKGITAALCRTTSDAELSRLHNGANVICLGARVSTQSDMEAMINTFLATEPEGDRHQMRRDMFKDLGSEV